MALAYGFLDEGNEIHVEKAMECIVDALTEHHKNGGRVKKDKHAHSDCAISK